MSKELKVEGTVPMFVRVSPESKRWIEKEAARTGHFIGHILTAVIDSVRFKRAYKIAPRVMKTLEKAKKQHEKRLARYQ